MKTIIIVTIAVLILAIILFASRFYIACKGGFAFMPYRLLNDPHLDRVSHIDSQHKGIPRNIYVTSHIPREDIPDLLSDSTKGFQLHFYDDERALEFMRTHYPQFIDVYTTLKLGAHKADLWRYCVLYKYGGVYLDIKVKPRVPLKDLLIYDDKYTWYVVLGGFRTEIFNGILATPPENPMIWQCILHIVRHPRPLWYLQYVNYLLMVVEDNYGRPVRPGVVDRPNDRLVIWDERCCVADGTTKGDYYGLACHTFDQDDNLLFDNRDPDYPWASRRSSKFIAARTFTGSKNGYVFRTDNGVTGYYLDVGKKN